MKQQLKQGKRNEIGGLGELIVQKQLKRRNWRILDTNYLKKWGEIDIIAEETRENKKITHFIEVKTVSYETKHDLQIAISRGTWRPEENVHYKKLQRLRRTIETWIAEHPEQPPFWQIDVITVRVVPREKYARLTYLENIIID